MGMFDDIPVTNPPPDAASGSDTSPPPSGGMFDDIPAAAPPAKEPAPSWGQVAKTAAGNIPSSAGAFVSSMAQPFIHPVDTARNLKNVGLGVAEKTGLSSGTGHEQYADAVGHYFAGRYGGMDNFKRALAEDPVGVAGDISTIFTGGETALARVPALAKAAEIAGTAAKVTNPISAVTKPLSAVGSAAGYLAAEGAGAASHTGRVALRTAASAGREGGPAADAFLEHLRDNAPMEGPVNDAKKALDQIRAERSSAYKQGMANLSQNQQVIPGAWQTIAKDLRAAGAIQTFKGQSLSPSTQAIRAKIADAVGEWYKLDPAEYHTAEGFDALKKKIGDIRDDTEFHSPERAVADRVYNSIKGAIVKHDPEYAKTMKGYEEASDKIREIEKTLSTTPNASIDSQLRRLQSVLRDNVNTSYGRRAELAKYLVDAGAPHLMEKLAGQTLKSVTPRGLGKGIFSGELGGALMALATGHPMIAAGAVPAMAVSSPRLMGEAAYYAGKASKYFPGQATAQAISHPAFQAGRLGEPLSSVSDTVPAKPAAAAPAAPAGTPEAPGRPAPTSPAPAAPNQPVPEAGPPRGPLTVAGHGAGQQLLSGAGSLMQALAVGQHPRERAIAEKNEIVRRIQAGMSPEDAIASVRVPGRPRTVPPDAVAQRNKTTGAIRWRAPDGRLYASDGSPAGSINGQP